MDIETLNIRRMGNLDRLPWFDKDDQGRIRLADDAGLPPIIDVHSHVGWSYGISPTIDMTARPDLIYYFDYTFDQEFLEGEIHPTKEEGTQVEREFRQSLYSRTERCMSQTSANFADEMDRFNYQHACLLPIEIPFHKRSAFEVLEAAKVDPRFIPFAAVAPWPWSKRKERRLEKLLASGARAVKYHPEFQIVAPDNPHAVRFLAWCADHDVVVLTHVGYTGVEPAWLRRKSEPDRFRKTLETLPNLRIILGHTGLSRCEQCLAVARDFEDQVWVDVSGLHARDIRKVLDGFNRQKILYGSDWAFYPLAVAMARVLVATEDCPESRAGIFHDNAAQLLDLPAEIGP